MARPPERGWVRSQGADLELLTWGDVGKPGLMLVHGARAQADWWSFIAPFFAEDFRVAALSLPGMGRSGWRDRYAFEDFPMDAEAVAEAAGLNANGRPPTYVGHSFGCAYVFHMAGRRPERMGGAIMVDTSLRGPTPEAAFEHQKKAGLSPRPAGPGTGERRLYPSLADALGRFRLLPAQPARNLFLVDYVARHLLEPVTGADGDIRGWCWCYDPDFFNKFDYGAPPPITYGPAVRIPVAHIHGQHSAFRREPDPPQALPPHAIEFEIPAACHHVPIDEPLALVAALRALLAMWARA